MPIYTYRCQACENVLEKRQSFSEDALTTCQQCGGELRKVLHPVGIVFKGSGFYNTDYRASNGAAAKDSDDKGGDKTESGEASTSTSDTSKTSASDSKSDGEKPAATKSDTSPGSATKATAGAGSAKSE